MRNQGTPKTLGEAIENAISNAKESGIRPELSAPVIEAHVRDFMAQKFCAAMVALPEETGVDLKVLFDVLVQKPAKEAA